MLAIGFWFGLAVGMGIAAVVGVVICAIWTIRFARTLGGID